jgi:hypothetical protein
MELQEVLSVAGVALVVLGVLWRFAHNQGKIDHAVAVTIPDLLSDIKGDLKDNQADIEGLGVKVNELHEDHALVRAALTAHEQHLGRVEKTVNQHMERHP